MRIKKEIVVFVLVFLISFFIRFLPVLRYGYPIGWLDSEVHTYRMSILSRDPLMFFKFMLGMDLKPDIYPYNSEGIAFWFTNTNPFPIYLIGGILSFFTKEILAGYLTACILSSVGIAIIFFVMYRYTKNYIVSLVPAIILLLNPGEIWYWQQGAYTPLGGIFIYFLVIYYINEYFENKISWKIPSLLTAVLLLFYPPMIILLFPTILSILLVKRDKNIFKKIAIILVIALITLSYYFLVISKTYMTETVPFTQSFIANVIEDSSSPYHGAIYLTPLPLYILSALAIVFSLYKRDRLPLFYAIGFILMILTTQILLKINPDQPFFNYYLRMYDMTPQFTAIMTGFLIFFLHKRFVNSKETKIAFYAVLMILLILYYYSVSNIVSPLVNRHSNLDDYKYEAMLWVRKNTPENARLLLFNPYEINGYDWASFFYRYNYRLKFEEMNNLFSKNIINKTFFDYDYVVTNSHPLRTTNYTTSLVNISREIFVNYTEVYLNKEVSILKKP